MVISIRRTNWGIIFFCLGIVVGSYPTDCEEMKTKSGSTDDGEYCILIQNKLVSIYCHNMSSTKPGNYITLRSGPDWNKSEFRNTKPFDSSPDVETVFSKIALNVTKLQIIVNDFTFSTSSSTDLISSDRKEVTCSVGGDCGLCRPEDGKILLDIKGTSVAFSPLVTERKIVCSLYCNKHSDCKSFLFSAALSECILLGAPSACGSGHISEGFKYYEQKSCETTLGIRDCLYKNI